MIRQLTDMEHYTIKTSKFKDLKLKQKSKNTPVQTQT